MHWVVPQPRGHARGAFQTGGETHKIEGIGYRDHNWLNFAPIDAIECWDWGRVYDTEYSVIFADIVTTRKLGRVQMKPLLVFDPARLIYLTTELRKWSLVKSGSESPPAAESGTANLHRLAATDEGLSLEIDLHLQRVFQRIDPLADFNPLVRWLVRTFKGRPSITSYHSVGTGRLSLSGREHALACNAVHEFVTNV